VKHNDPFDSGATPAGQPAGRPILSVRNLVKWFDLDRSLVAAARRRTAERVTAVDGVSLDLMPNEVLGIVGESGSGKSTLARCLVSLYRPDGGQVLFDGRDMTNAGPRELRSLHRRMQMVFQDPFTSLNPRKSIGGAILEAGLVHGRVGSDKEGFVANLLSIVGLPSALAGRLPRALSGGQRQRAAIARALAVEPEVLIADEAVSALDLSIQAQILNLFADLKDRLGLAMVFIAHDLAVVSNVSDRVAIMYLGRIVEEGPVRVVFGDPQHPYTKALVAAHPDPMIRRRRDEAPIRGDVPSPFEIPSGCRYRSRCPYAEARCAVQDPMLEPFGGVKRRVACHVLPFANASVAEKA
jgi:oligopeptide/dipeptide ABC transporter ATP-binding protein